MLTVEAAGHYILTVEGLQSAPEQKAFIEQFAFQCGYCTSGFLMVCHALRTHYLTRPTTSSTRGLTATSAGAPATPKSAGPSAPS